MPRTKTIPQIRKELAAQERRLAALQARRRTVAGQLQRLDSEIASLGGETPVVRPGPARKVRKKAAKKKAHRIRKVAKKAVKRPVKKATRRARGARGKPLTQYLAEALSKAKAGMRARDLTAAVLKAGYVTKDRNFKQTVAKTLGTDRRFTRVRLGVYKLA